MMNKYCIARFSMNLAMQNLPGTYIILCGSGRDFLFRFKNFDGAFLRFEEYQGGLGQLIHINQLSALIKQDKIGILIPSPLKDLFEDLDIIVEETVLPIEYEEETSS